MKFFKSEDFDSSTLFDTLPKYIREAAIANAKLEREGKVVFGKLNISNKMDEFGERNLDKTDTHQALLINIKPIEKCKHVISSSRNGDGPWELSTQFLICSACGAKLKPPESYEAVE